MLTILRAALPFVGLAGFYLLARQAIRRCADQRAWRRHERVRQERAARQGPKLIAADSRHRSTR
jgi:hypothetical protein